MKHDKLRICFETSGNVAYLINPDDQRMITNANTIINSWADSNPDTKNGNLVYLAVGINNGKLILNRTIKFSEEKYIPEQNYFLELDLPLNFDRILIHFIHIRRLNCEGVFFNGKPYPIDSKQPLKLGNQLYVIATTTSYTDMSPPLYVGDTLNPAFFLSSEIHIKKKLIRLNERDTLLVLPQCAAGSDYQLERDAFSFASKQNIYSLPSTTTDGVNVYVAPTCKRFERSDWIIPSPPTAIFGHGENYNTAHHCFNEELSNDAFYSSEDSVYASMLQEIKNANDDERANVLVKWFHHYCLSDYHNTIRSISHQITGQLSELNTDMQQLEAAIVENDVEKLIRLFDGCSHQWALKPLTYFSPFHTLMRAWYLFDRNANNKTCSPTEIVSIAKQQLKLPKDVNSNDEQFQNFVARFSQPLLCKPILHNDQLTLTEYIDKIFDPDTSPPNTEKHKEANVIKKEISQLLGIEVTPQKFNLLEACLSLDVLFLFCYPNGFDISSLCDGADNQIKKLAKNTRHKIGEIIKAIDKLKGVVDKKTSSPI